MSIDSKHKNNYCVYKHTSKIDGRAYVGITRVGVEHRWKNGCGYKKNIYFWRYIKKYGWDSLTHEILYDRLSEEEAINKESLSTTYLDSNVFRLTVSFRNSSESNSLFIVLIE